MAIDPDRQIPESDALEQTANLLFFDALVRHQIFILRMSGQVRNEITELLNATERDIAERVRRRLLSGRGPTPAQMRRVDALIADLRSIRGAAHDAVEAHLVRTMNRFVVNEAKFLAGTAEAVVPVQINVTTPAPATLRALVRERPFEGRTLRSWARDLRRADLQRIEDQIKIGVVQGESNQAIARRIVGSARLRGRDGVTQITRRNAEAISRTATNHFSNQARAEVMSDNSDIFDTEVYVATLDSRTTPICRSLDGDRFPVGEGPIPPLHMGCRSLRVAVLTDELIGDRPAKPVTQRMLVREYSQQNGLSATRRAQLPRGHKGAFDQFARRRTRELIGRGPAKTTYQQWLGRQSREFQDDVLGSTRAKLFRDGNLTLDRFVNRAGDEIPLADLARTDAAAFRAAGLDPGDFLRRAA